MQRGNAALPGNQHAADTPAGPAAPAPPPATWQDLTPLQREFAARLAGLRSARCGQPRNAAARGPQAGPTRLCATSPGRNALHCEPTAHPGGARPPTALPYAASAPARPAPHKPPAPAAAHPWHPLRASLQTETAGRNAVHREPTARPASAKPPAALPSVASAPARPASHKPRAPHGPAHPALAPAHQSATR